MQLSTPNPYLTFSTAWVTNAVNAVLDHMPIIGLRRRVGRRMRE